MNAMNNSTVVAEALRDDPGATFEKEPRLIRRMRLCFAMISCLGGLAMGIGDQTELLAVAATFFAVFGFVCVDWLKLFALPAVLVYTLMALAGMYCVSEFASTDGRQIEAVAELLVVVQAVMMLQLKSQRVYEQIIIFCLLQLVVAAVFNDAIQYGLLLLPVGIVGAWGHSLLAAFAAATVRDDSAPLANAFVNDFADEDQIVTSSEEAQLSYAFAAKRVFWVACLTIAPAVMMVTGIFFYALPRTMDANKTNQAGNAMIGFSDQVSLNQVGKMLRNDEQALRVTLTERVESGERLSLRPYLVSEPMYLRGKVLEKYAFESTSASNEGQWSAIPAIPLTFNSGLPQEMDLVDFNLGPAGDTVEVAIQLESTDVRSLFAISPYFETRKNHDVVHEPLKWTLKRSNKIMSDALGASLPRMTYRFATRGFRGGLQSEYTEVWSRDDPWGRSHSPRSSVDGELPTRDEPDDQRVIRIQLRNTAQDAYRKYVDACLEFESRQVPSAKELSDRIMDAVPVDRRGPYAFARQATSFLNTASGGFEYSLDLNFDRVAGVDPIEQFLSLDKSGHCQFFASALAMMLRAQGIPSRLVVGYCTDEYNPVGKHYVARQLHAHVWVEALMNRDDLPGARDADDASPQDPLAQECWVRLDPTPGGGGGGLNSEQESDGVSQVLDIAQNIWKDYVVDMDSQRQEQALLASATDAGMSDAYGDLIRRVQLALLNIRAGRLGGGSLAGRELFSWTGAIAGVGGTLFLFLLLRLKPPNWWRKIRGGESGDSVARPSLEFYATALEKVSRLGVRRSASQTPSEVEAETRRVAGDGSRPPSEPFSRLTELFYRIRYRGDDADASDMDGLLADLDDRIDSRKATT